MPRRAFACVVRRALSKRYNAATGKTRLFSIYITARKDITLYSLRKSFRRLLRCCVSYMAFAPLFIYNTISLLIILCSIWHFNSSI